MMFNRDYRLGIQSVMLVFSTGFVNLRPLTFSLISSTTLPCVNKYTVYTYTMCKGRSMGSKEGRGSQTDKTPAAKSLYRSIIFLDNDFWHYFLSV
jgi:hypothetical protein